MLRALAFGVALLLSVPARAYVGSPQCDHRWLASGGNAVTEGVYTCDVAVTRADFLADRFVYVDEVGDTSYLKLISINGEPISVGAVSHGMWPANDERAQSTPRYTRFLPFVVPLERFWNRAGTYRFEIHHRDVVQWEKGVRASPIGIESLPGAAVRFVAGNPRLAALFLQAVYFFLALLLSLHFRSGELRRDGAVAAAITMSFLTMLQLSGLFRYFLPPFSSLLLLYSTQLLTYLSYCVALETLLAAKTRGLARFRQSAIAASAGVILVGILCGGHRLDFYLSIFGAGLFATGPITMFAVSYFLLTGRAAFVDALRTTHVRVGILLCLGTIVSFDLFNWVFVRQSHFFLSHFVFFSSMVTLFLHSQLALRMNSLDYLSRLRTVIGKAVTRLALPGESTYDILSEMSVQLGALFSASRVSIVEIDEQTVKLLGAAGNYTEISSVAPLKSDSVLQRLISESSLQHGARASFAPPSTLTDYWVIPIFLGDKLRGAVCLTDFSHGFLMPFYEQRLDAFRNEIETCVNHLFSRRDAMTYESILRIERQRLNPLLIETETYLLNNFLVAESQRKFAFVMGDLVGSVTLREVFGNAAVDEAIQACLAHSWENNRSLAGIVDIREGDSFSLTFPSLVADGEDKGPADRALAWIQNWNASDSIFQEMAKRLGISSEFTFRVVMGELTASVPQAVVKRFEYDANPVKDTAARVLKDVCLPGECVLIGRTLANKLDGGVALNLEGRRLRGKKIAVDLFVLNKHASSPSASNNLARRA